MGGWWLASARRARRGRRSLAPRLCTSSRRAQSPWPVAGNRSHPGPDWPTTATQDRERRQASAHQGPGCSRGCSQAHRASSEILVTRPNAFDAALLRPTAAPTTAP